MNWRVIFFPSGKSFIKATANLILEITICQIYCYWKHVFAWKIKYLTISSMGIFCRTNIIAGFFKISYLSEKTAAQFSLNYSYTHNSYLESLLNKGHPWCRISSSDSRALSLCKSLCSSHCGCPSSSAGPGLLDQRGSHSCTASVEGHYLHHIQRGELSPSL